MSLESGVSRLILSRRKFIPIMLAAGAGPIIKPIAGTAETIAVSTPLVTKSSTTDLQYDVYPGSLEDHALKAVQKSKGSEAGLKFIDPKKEGPLGLVKAVVFNPYDQSILKIAQTTVALQWAQINNDERASGSELYLLAYRQSLADLRALHSTGKVMPGTNLQVEADHWANYAVTAAATPHYTLAEAKLLGVVPENASDDLVVPNWTFSHKGFARLGNPIIYGVEKSNIDIVDGEPFEQGTERWGHLAYHAFFTSSYKYFKQINHPLKDATPTILRAGKYHLSQQVPLSVDQEALFLSELMGWLYEVKTTISPEYNQSDKSRRAFLRHLGIGNYYTNEGLLDTRLMEDIWANALGAALGIAKLNAILSGQDPEPIISQLADPKFKWTSVHGPQFLTPIGAAA